MTVHDDLAGIAFPTLVMYPTQAPSSFTYFGPYAMDVSPDAPIAPGRFPVVIVSHGGGGSHLVYRTITTHLARSGYIVVMLEHPGNNRNDNCLADTRENLVNRPRHVRMTIDAVLSDDMFSQSVLSDNVAVMGHSLGGYTALAVAGGIPWSGPGQKIKVVPDPRVQALVLLAPAAAFYQPDDALNKVTVPILMLAAEHDDFTPLWQAEAVLNGVPDRTRVTYRVVENAGHFSFLSPFPPRMRHAGFRPSTDPEGFDRDAFHARLPLEIKAYLDEVMR